MVVGFVNSGMMTLKQAINVIMGANKNARRAALVHLSFNIIGTAQDSLNLHQSLREIRDGSEEFRERYREYTRKYALP